MTYRCEVVGPWVRVGNTNEMAVALAYPASWTDVTMQPDENITPDPNAFVALGEHLSETQADAIVIDNNFTVLWIEEETD